MPVIIILIIIFALPPLRTYFAACICGWKTRRNPCSENVYKLALCIEKIKGLSRSDYSFFSDMRETYKIILSTPNIDSNAIRVFEAACKSQSIYLPRLSAPASSQPVSVSKPSKPPVQPPKDFYRKK